MNWAVRIHNINRTCLPAGVNTYQLLMAVPLTITRVDKASAFKVLERSFTEAEWRFLVGQPIFIGLIAKETWDEQELNHLKEAGVLLLKRKKDWDLLDKPSKPSQ